MAVQVASSIPGREHWVRNLALLQLWCGWGVQSKFEAGHGNKGIRNLGGGCFNILTKNLKVMEQL